MHVASSATLPAPKSVIDCESSIQIIIWEGVRDIIIWACLKMGCIWKMCIVAKIYRYFWILRIKTPLLSLSMGIPKQHYWPYLVGSFGRLGAAEPDFVLFKLAGNVRDDLTHAERWWVDRTILFISNSISCWVDWRGVKRGILISIQKSTSSFRITAPSPLQSLAGSIVALKPSREGGCQHEPQLFTEVTWAVSSQADQVAPSLLGGGGLDLHDLHNPW